MGIRDPNQVTSILENSLPFYLQYLPPIIMLSATSKLFVFWIFDIVVIILVTRAGWSASNYHKYVDETIRQYAQNMSRTNPAFEDPQADIAAQKQENKQLQYLNEQSANQEVSERPVASQPETPDRYNDTSVQAFVYPYKRHDENRQKEHTNREQNVAQRPNSLALQSKINERPSPQHNQNNQQDHDREIENRLSHFTTSNGNVIRTKEPLNDENISERQQQPARVRVLPMVAEINRHSSETKQRPPVPPKPHNPNRVSQNPSFVDDRRSDRPDSRNSASKVDRTSSMNAPEELRGQLPWSYFKARDDIPKRAFMDLNEDEELPRVPIPDYTLHFPKTKRANLSDSDGDGSWSRYDQSQRY